ncbi:MAG: hypothetical protein ABW224_14020 [Kibdelosporangium sp.]
MPGKRYSPTTRLPTWLGGGIRGTGDPPVENTNRPVFVDPSGRRVVAARLSAAALTLAGVAFITGAGVLLSNQPTPTALADALNPGVAARVVGVDPIIDALTNSLTGDVAPGQPTTVPRQVVPGIDGTAGAPTAHNPAGVLPGPPASGSPDAGQGQPTPAAPHPGAPLQGAKSPAPPVVPPAAEAPPVITPPVDVPPVVVPPVVVPPVVEPPAEPALPVVGPAVDPVVDPVVDTVGSLLGDLL